MWKLLISGGAEFQIIDLTQAALLQVFLALKLEFLCIL